MERAIETKKILCGLAIFCLMTCVLLSGLSNAEEASVDDAAWWESNELIAVGYGVPSTRLKTAAQTRLSARNAAKADAYRNLAKQAGEIRITANSKLRTEQIKAVIVGAKIISEEYDFEGGCEIVMSVPIFGVNNSLAQAALKPVEKEAFPEPESVGEEETEGNYTGLIIDCGEFELNPVLAPEIHNDEDESIYSYRNLDYDDAIARGVASYVEREAIELPSTIEPTIETQPHVAKPVEASAPIERREEERAVLGATVPNNVSRAGSRPLVIVIVRMNADGTCPVISASDADKILRENRVSHFLDGGSVVFMSNRIRGMRL